MGVNTFYIVNETRLITMCPGLGQKFRRRDLWLAGRLLQLLHCVVHLTLRSLASLDPLVEPSFRVIALVTLATTHFQRTCHVSLLLYMCCTRHFNGNVCLHILVPAVIPFPNSCSETEETEFSCTTAEEQTFHFMNPRTVKLICETGLKPLAGHRIDTPQPVYVGYFE